MKNVLKLCLPFLLFMSCNADNKEAAVMEDTSTAMMAETPAKPAPAVILDMSMSVPFKKSLEAFAAKDIDGFAAIFDDNVRFTWSGGDSLIGKQAIKDYYTGRFKIIDSISYSDYIFLPVQVNEAQSQYAQTGKWMLYWAFAHAKYKNGKKLDFWVHQVNHLNDAGKVDYAGQYVDRGKIMATSK